MMKRDKIKNPVITINVANIDKTAKEIEKNKGKIVIQRFQVGNMGYAAYFKDTEGNIFGLWQNIEQ